MNTAHTYEKPQITRLVTGLMNKYGLARGAPAQRICERIDGVPVEKLVKDHGSPLFVFSERTIVRTVRRVRQAFAQRYPSVVLGWSYKTNYLQAICALMHREGSIAEVVSQMEYDKARKLGIPGDQIVFNGPYKPLPALRRAVAEGAMIHADHQDELDDLAAIAAERGEILSVGLRLNLDAGIHPQWTRFGLNLESGQALAAVEKMAQGGRLRLAGLHCHIGTYILDPTAYARQVEKMTAFANLVEDRFGWRISWLDLGGGLPSRSRLKGTYASTEAMVPPVEDYAEAICEALDRHLRPGHRPRLILEPGRALVDEAGSLITTVVAGKALPDGTPAYICDAGVNLLYTATWFTFDIRAHRTLPGTPVPSLLGGPLCMNIDIIEERINLPPVPRGTHLVLACVGAYNVTQWMQFIAYRPAVVLITEAGEVEVIREGEGLGHVEHGERLPARLALA